MSTVRSTSGFKLFNMHVVSLDKSMFDTLCFTTSLPIRQLTFEVLLDHVQTPGLSFIKLLRATQPLLSESHY